MLYICCLLSLKLPSAVKASAASSSSPASRRASAASYSSDLFIYQPRYMAPAMSRITMGVIIFASFLAFLTLAFFRSSASARAFSAISASCFSRSSRSDLSASRSGEAIAARSLPQRKQAGSSS